MSAAEYRSALYAVALGAICAINWGLAGLFVSLPIIVGIHLIAYRLEDA